MAISVLLVDDHQMFRAGLRALLESEGAIEVVGEAGTGEEALEQVRSLRPEVAVMDLSMPDLDGLEATRRIDALDSETEVLVLTVHAEEEYLGPVVDAGASGYLTKTGADRELVAAIKTVARGKVYLPGPATQLLLREYRASGEDEHERGLEKLSSREQQVLALTAEGYSSREIGEQLSISPKTVDTYRSRITSKLGLDHRSELVRFALRVGLLQDVGAPKEEERPRSGRTQE